MLKANRVYMVDRRRMKVVGIDGKLLEKTSVLSGRVVCEYKNVKTWGKIVGHVLRSCPGSSSTHRIRDFASSVGIMIGLLLRSI